MDSQGPSRAPSGQVRTQRVQLSSSQPRGAPSDPDGVPRRLPGQGGGDDIPDPGPQRLALFRGLQLNELNETCKTRAHRRSVCPLAPVLMEILRRSKKRKKATEKRVLKYIYAPQPVHTSRPDYTEMREIWVHILLDNNRVLIVSSSPLISPSPNKL